VDGVAERDHLVLLGLDERTAAVWQAGAWRALGDGAVTVIVGGSRRRFEAGSRVDGLPTPAADASEG
jgi:hypothetical protein